MLFLDPLSSIAGSWDALMHRDQQYILTSTSGLVFQAHSSYSQEWETAPHSEDHVSLWVRAHVRILIHFTNLPLHRNSTNQTRVEMNYLTLSETTFACFSFFSFFFPFFHKKRKFHKMRVWYRLGFKFACISCPPIILDFFCSSGSPSGMLSPEHKR